MLFTFDGEPQARQGIIPLAGDVFQAAARGFELARFNFPQALAADTDVADQAGAGQDVQVFGDGLAGDVRAVGEAGYGEGAYSAEADDQVETGFVAEGGENWRGGADDVEGGAG